MRGCSDHYVSTCPRDQADVLVKGGDKPNEVISPTPMSPATAVDPSEAPSSPTIAETPLKKTSHQPGHSTPTEDTEIAHTKLQNHVAFASPVQPRTTEAMIIPSSAIPVTATEDPHTPAHAYTQPGEETVGLGLQDEEEDGRRSSMMTDTVIPEGMGSKRLYKMSKMFSKFIFLYLSVPMEDHS